MYPINREQNNRQAMCMAFLRTFVTEVGPSYVPLLARKRRNMVFLDFWRAEVV